jgi:4-coumarate--CoA ligase
MTACILIGAVVNPLDVSLSQEDLLYLFGQFKPKFIVCDLEALEATQKAIEELKLDTSIFVTSRTTPQGIKSFQNELLAPTGNENDFVPPKFDKPANEKIAAIICSSGTTGKPKGVKIVHSHMLAWSNFYDRLPRSISLIFSPVFWATGFYPHVLKAFKPNDTYIMSSQSFSIDCLSEVVEKYQVTHLTVPPFQLISILQSNFSKICNHKSLKTIICIGSLVSESLRKKFHETFPDKELSIGYGMTEVSVCLSAPGEFMKNLSVGSVFVPNITMKVIDENGTRLGVGEDGEFCIKPAFEFLVSFMRSEKLEIFMLLFSGVLQQPSSIEKCR